MRGYLGCYGADIGILSGDGGSLTVRPGAAATNPSYLALSADGGVLYAVMESGEGGRVGAYAVEGDGLRPLGTQPTGGTSACHVSVHPGGRSVLSANYGTGSVAVHPIRRGGSLGRRADLIRHAGSGPDPERQRGPHAHMVVAEPSGELVLAVDLGTDTVYRYRLDDGRLRLAASVALPAGSGPRHVAFHPSGRYAYVAGELDSTATIVDLAAFAVRETVSTVLEKGGSAPSFPSAIRVSDDGRFCYVANRGPDTIAVLALDGGGTSLRLVATVPCGGEHPRDLVLAGGYLYVANQHSDTVTGFRVDPATGVPSPAGTPMATPRPSCIVFAR